MTYSKSTLQKIGKEVIKRHPEIATTILDKIPVPQSRELELIPSYFEAYCRVTGINPQCIFRNEHDRQISEAKHVFISAMAVIYNGQLRFQKTICETLRQDPAITSKILQKVVFRYRKDYDFKTAVDNILNKLRNDNRAA